LFKYYLIIYRSGEFTCLNTLQYFISVIILHRFTKFISLIFMNFCSWRIKYIIIKSPYRLQAMQLLVCDWLLLTRTESWQRERSERSSEDEEVTSSADPSPSPNAVPSSDLMAFQNDLASLRKLATSLKAAIPRVSVTFLFKVTL